jgi:hypothetical protein
MRRVMRTRTVLAKLVACAAVFATLGGAAYAAGAVRSLAQTAVSAAVLRLLAVRFISGSRGTCALAAG